MTQTFEIIVAGGGMVGAALATGLGQSGFSVALVDRQSPPETPSDGRPDIRVSALSAGSEQYLRALGAWQGIHCRNATPYRRLAVWDETRHPLSHLLPGNSPEVTFNAAELGCDHLGHIVENRITQQALWEAADRCPDVTIIPDSGVAGTRQTDSRIHVTLDDGRELSSQLLVAADGGQSRLRDMAGIGVHRDQYAQQAMVISVRYRGAPEDITWQGFYPSGPRAFLPLHSAEENHPGESWASLVWYDEPGTLSELKNLSHEALAGRIQQDFPDRLPTITHVDARAGFPIARQHAHQYFRDRIVLVGDAAHTINPLAGQGVNLGFQDAEALQTAIREARRQGLDLASPQWLAHYEQQRRPANRRMMLAMDLFYYLFSNRIPPVHLARNLGLGAVRALPFARNRVARYAMGIDGRLPAVIRELAARVPDRLKLI